MDDRDLIIRPLKMDPPSTRNGTPPLGELPLPQPPRDLATTSGRENPPLPHPNLGTATTGRAHLEGFGEGSLSAHRRAPDGVPGGDGVVTFIAPLGSMSASLRRQNVREGIDPVVVVRGKGGATGGIGGNNQAPAIRTAEGYDRMHSAAILGPAGGSRSPRRPGKAPLFVPNGQLQQQERGGEAGSAAGGSPGRVGGTTSLCLWAHGATPRGSLQADQTPRSEASSSRGGGGVTSTITQESALWHWDAYHAGSDHAVWRSVWDGLCSAYPDAVKGMDATAVVALRNELVRERDLEVVTAMLFERFTVSGGLPKALWSFRESERAARGMLKALDAEGAEYERVLRHVESTTLSSATPRVISIEAMVGNEAQEGGQPHEVDWRYLVCSRRRLIAVLRRGFLGGGGGDFAQCWEQGVVFAGEGGDAGVLQKLLICSLAVGGGADGSAAAADATEGARPLFLVTLVLTSPDDLHKPPPPPPILPAPEAHRTATPNRHTETSQTDGVRGRDSSAQQQHSAAVRTREERQSPSRGMGGAVEMLLHEDSAVRGYALDMLLALVRCDDSSRAKVVNAVTSLDHVLLEGEGGEVERAAVTLAAELCGGEGGAAGDGGGGHCLVACGDKGAAALGRLLLGFQNGGGGPEEESGGMVGTYIAERALTVAGRLALRDDMASLLVMCGVAEAAAGAAVRAARGSDGGIRGRGVRILAFVFLSRVLCACGEDAALLGVVEGERHFWAVVCESLGEEGEEGIKAARVVCCGGVYQAVREMLLSEGALCAAVAVLKRGGKNAEAAAEVLGVLCLNRDASVKAVEQGCVGVLLGMLAGQEPHGTTHLRCLEAMASLSLHPPAREALSKHPDCRAALLAILASPSSSLRKRAAFLITSLGVGG